MEFLLDGIRAVTPQQCVMYVVGALLIYLAIKKDYEPSLLLPMGFGAILVNLPMSGVLNAFYPLIPLMIMRASRQRGAPWRVLCHHNVKFV